MKNGFMWKKKKNIRINMNLLKVRHFFLGQLNFVKIKTIKALLRQFILIAWQEKMFLSFQLLWLESPDATKKEIFYLMCKTDTIVRVQDNGVRGSLFISCHYHNQLK